MAVVQTLGQEQEGTRQAGCSSRGRDLDVGGPCTRRLPGRTSWPSPRTTWLRFSKVTVARRSTVSGSATPPPQSSALPACRLGAREGGRMIGARCVGQSGVQLGLQPHACHVFLCSWPIHQPNVQYTSRTPLTCWHSQSDAHCHAHTHTRTHLRHDLHDGSRHGGIQEEHKVL